jgi:glycerol uptake facilitator-like aquaporin
MVGITLRTADLTWLNSAIISEFIGSFIFCLTVPLAEMHVGSYAPLPNGFILMAMVFAFGYMSGGYFNPAVTFAAMCVGHLPTPRGMLYIFAQVAAGFSSALYAALVVGTKFPTPNADDDLLKIWQTLCGEAAFTFALATVVLHVLCSKQRHNEFYGFAIGFAMTASMFAVGGLKGGAFNPAVASGTQVVACFLDGNCEPLMHAWVYWAAPMGGSFVAALVFKILGAGEPASETDLTPPPEAPVSVETTH